MVNVCGYAIPFYSTIFHSDRYEFVESDAFDAVLAKAPDVTLQFYDHDAGARILASTADYSLTLVTDDHGLAFAASLDKRASDTWRAHRMIVEGRARCSVFSHMDGPVICRHRGSDVVAIDRAADLVHIAIVDVPAYADTGVWLSGCTDGHGSDHIRQLSQRWNRSAAAGWPLTKWLERTGRARI